MEYDSITYEWDDSHRYSPAPRHRRRIIKKMLKKFQYGSVLDAGCAQPYLLKDFVQSGKTGFGCDISNKVIEKNRLELPNCQFESFDLCHQRYPSNQQFDLVICSEVLEHLLAWRSALNNICQMSRKYVLITVPCGEIRYIDKKVGHLQHFQNGELIRALNDLGFTPITIKKWGFPIHTLYKVLVNSITPEKIFQEFSISNYSRKKIFLSHCLYYMFYLNDLFNSGEQLFILAKKNDISEA